MNQITSNILGLSHAIWDYLLLSSPYLLLGLVLSGLIYSFISEEKIKAYLGGKGFGGILKGALIGVPLPLCSCAVIPTAVTLRKSGASNGATSSFLISTPESGVDSMALTYGLIDWPMTVLRPVAAFLTAFTAGFLQMLFNDFEAQVEKKQMSCCGCKDQSTSSASSSNSGLWQKLIKGAQFAYRDLVNDLAFWLTLGILGGGLISYYVPEGYFTTLGPTTGRIMVMLIGIPLYVCASAITPLAASLMLKGMGPGTVLLLLLVGPATNLSNILVMQKYIGKRGVLINLLTILFLSLGLSYLVDFLYATFSWPPLPRVQNQMLHEENEIFQVFCGVVMSLLLLKGLWQKHLRSHLVK